MLYVKALVKKSLVKKSCLSFFGLLLKEKKINASKNPNSKLSSLEYCFGYKSYALNQNYFQTLPLPLKRTHVQVTDYTEQTAQCHYLHHGTTA